VASGIAALAVLVIIAVGGGALWLRSSLPVTDGTLVLQGLDAPVRISRDTYGIPTIRAQSEHDADFALGFVHAQDRLVAMAVMRRFGAGRLSEVFGPATLGIDRIMRTLGLYRAAEAQYAALSPQVQQAIAAYAEGVNAFIATRTGALPPEYYLLGQRPAPWRPADTLVWGKIMDLELTGDFRGELLRARLLTKLSPQELQLLFPEYPKTAPIVLQNERAMLEGLPLGRLYALLPPQVGPEAASNNWVVDGAHSQSGKPILANDPHLDFAAPGVWYLARIETPGRTLAGVTAPGTPFLIIGHNEHIAWGFTTTLGDVEDLFIEKVDPTNPQRYLAPDGPRPFDVRQEEIDVKGAAPVTLTIRSTRHGPVISDLAGYAVGDTVLALETTWLGADDRTPDALWAMERARDWGEFHAALANFAAPQQNIVYADVDGHIGFIAPGRIPIRASGGDGWLPQPGWTDAHDWTGSIPFDKLPTAVDPPSGRFVSANNKIVPDDYPFFITHNWQAPWRAERINALLDRGPKQSPETTAAIQADDISLPARTLLPLLLPATPVTGDTRVALALLHAWDARMARDRPEPLIFEAWMRELMRTLLADRLGPYFPAYWGLRYGVVQSLLTDHREWCGSDGDCGKALSQSLERALAQLRETYGTNIGAWRWGVPHKADFANQIWSQVPLVGRWFDASLGADGGQDTIDAGAMDIADEAAPFLDRHGPTLRMIVDMAAPDEARFMIAPGESGNPLSPHWDDLALPWRDKQYITFGGDESGGVLVLKPQ
jgi:penicillin amidase